jgi:hypothetical protein
MGGHHLPQVDGEQGATAIVVALMIIFLIGVAAFAIDFSHLYLVKGELQNAADAGCLAGARFLYEESGEDVNENANQIAYDAAILNHSEGNPVEVQWSGGNEGDIERGHWSFTTRTFTPNNNGSYTALWDVSSEELDADTNFINGIRVRTRRESNSVPSFFARVFGYESFFLSSESVAYVGFAGTLGPGEVEQPMAICRESLLVNDQYNCSIGRMITNHEEVAGQETGGWTDFSQDDPCFTGTNEETVRSLICGGGNPGSIILGQPIATHGGYIPNAHGLLRSCWQILTGETQPWTVTLPVIECSGNNIDLCARVVGTVTVNIVWMTPWEEDPTYSWAPWQMENPRTGTTWSSSNPDGQVRWNSFVQDFNLQKLDGSPVPYQRRGVYFLPDCNFHQPRGRTGGDNFGVMAKIPVLVR